MTAKENERCDIRIEPGRKIKIVPSANAESLNEMQLADYREHRCAFIEWVRSCGKNPEKREGYSDYTAYESAYRTARFDAWAWEAMGRYSIPPAPDRATEYIDDVVAYRDVSNSTKGKIEEALKRYYRWASEATHVGEWDRDQQFNSGGNDAPRDYLTRRERRLVRDAALEAGDSWRVPSIVFTSLDAALRPVEVNRARPEWVDVDNELLRIPREESSKNTDNWRAALTSRTARALDEWLDERARDPMYDDRDELWLTREATPYSSQSLSRLIKRLFDDAGIGTGGRSVTWYSLRHSTGTFMTEERDLKAAKDQLRHKTSKTTMKYDQVSADTRRNSLENM